VVVASLPAVPGVASTTKGYRLTASVRDHLVERARAEYPREACGVLLWHPETRAHGHLDAQNVAREPERRFMFDGKTMKKIRQHMTDGWKLEAIFHSHPNGRVNLSPDDILDAAPAGRPLYPGVVYLVVSLIKRPDGTLWAGITGHLWKEGSFRPVRIAQNPVS
jgi:proteasome lid subunit RPN8/RPN11